MSIDSVRARVAEIQARIASLSTEPYTPPDASQPDLQLTPTAPLDGKSSFAGGRSVQPFDIALAAKCGQMAVKPVDGSNSEPGRLPEEIETLIAKYSALNGLDPSVVRAVVRAESDGNPMEVSSKGAVGLMQLMPEELKAYGVKNPFDLEQNIMGGTRQLAEKLKTFNGDLRLALAAYNAGTSRVKEYGGVPPIPETQKYVQKIFGMLGR